jgi:eukaryotic-like serine/threonine-protein kinase
MDPAQLQPGHRLDRYELLCPLAYGGMASVWLARFGGRKGFERLVVVKMILPQYSQDPRFQEMFVDEARIASRIEHANVARILDVGEHEESTFIVMEWVDGDSLSKVVRAAETKKQRIPAGIALRICADAAAGLHAAHILRERDGTHLGVVHRDVSPQNILISNAGSTVIIDFGVAKARDRVSQDTSAGQLKGKIRYMAPEQALGRAVDHRADVWALGAILYELITGVAPYDGPNEVATLHKLTSGQGYPPLPREVPDAICAVIDRALAYDPEGRYATALEMSLAIESCLQEIGEPTTTAVVAHYTELLLSDRKAARRRAVDTALAAAHARDAERSSSLPMPVVTPGIPIPRQMNAQSTTARLAAPPIPISSPSLISERGERTSAPSGPLGVGGLSETPSSTSNATLGSAAMEYPPHVPDDPARRRRVVTAALLGVSVAVGLVGAVLIIFTTVLRPHPQGTAAGGGRTSAPAETVEPPMLVTPPTATAEPSPATATQASPSAATTSTGAQAAATASAIPSVVTVAPPSTQVVAPPPPSALGASTPATSPPHRPVAPPPAVPKPVPKPPTPATTTKPDRGF